MRVGTLAAICVAFIGVSAIRIDAPFLRHAESVCTEYGTIARNFVRFGAVPLRFGLLQTGSPDLSAYDDWRSCYYPHRPPLAALTLSLWFRLFGIHEWSIRLNLILVAVGTLLLFAAVARRLLPSPWDLVGTAFFALIPSFAYFSHVVVHLAYGLFFSLLAWYANLRWEDGRRFRVLLFLALFSACFSDWMGYYAALSIALHRFRGGRSWLSYSVVAGAVACFGLFLAHQWWIAPDGRWVRQILTAGAERSVQAGVPIGRYVVGEGREVVLYFTAGLLALSAAGAIVALRQKSRAILCFLLLPLEEIVFLRLAYDHDYYTYALAPFLALTAGAGARWCWEARGRKPVLIGLVLLASIQATWILWKRQTTSGAYEVQWRAGTAIRSATRPEDRILLTIPEVRPHTTFYSERCVTGREPGSDKLAVHPLAEGIHIADLGALLRHVQENPRRYDVVVAGDLESARREIAFLSGGSAELFDRFGFYPEDHPLRHALDRLAVRKESRGAFVFYWMR